MSAGDRLQPHRAVATQSVTLQRRVTTAVTPSPRVLEIATMFGVGVDEEREINIIPPTRITLRPGSIVYVSGPSGGGKSTILRLIHEAIPGAIVFDAALDDLDDRPIIEQIGATLGDAMRALSLAGLADAFIMLRPPSELSDGQRHRFAMARTIARAERMQADGGTFPVVLADEFAATLDRLTAAVVARNVSRWVRQHGRVCLVTATTHEDLLESLAPETLVYVSPGGRIEVCSPRGSR